MTLRSLLKVDFVDLCRDSAKIESKLSSLLSLLHRLTLSTAVATRQCLKASFRHCARCSIGCSGRWGSSGRKWQNCVMQYRLLTSFSSDATRPSPSKLGWRSLLPRLTCVLIGLSALCWTSWLNRRLVRALGIAIASVALLSLTTSCGSSRKATSSLQLTAYMRQRIRSGNR